MQGRRKSTKVFYGWWVVLAAGVGQSVSYVPLISLPFGTFLLSLSQEFNWSRSEISLAHSLSMLMMAAALPLIGRLADRFGARTVIVFSVLVSGLSLLSLYVLPGSLWYLYTAYMVIGALGAGSTPVPYSGVISRWFDQRRGLALGLAAVGLGVGSFITPLLVQALVASVGWREAYAALGLIAMIVAIPTVGLFLHETPQMVGLLPDGGSMAHTRRERQPAQEEGMSGGEALRTGTFWLMVGAFLLASVCAYGTLTHIVPVLVSLGIATHSAAVAASLLGAMVLVGRVGVGYLLDRFSVSRLAVCCFCAAAVGFFLLWIGAAGGWAFVAAALIGFVVGADGDMIAYAVSRYFGLRAFGEIYGYAVITVPLGGTIGPVLLGAGFDSTGSYRLVLGAFVLTMLAAIGLATQLGSYPTWENATAGEKADLGGVSLHRSEPATIVRRETT